MPILGLATANVGQSPPTWLLALFPLFFIVVWCGVTTLLGVLAGHAALLSRYPPVDERCDPSFLMASGRMGWVNFNSALFVGVGSQGLHLAPSWLFRPIFHRGIPCIPWHEVRLISAGPGGLLGLFRGTRFAVPAVDVEFSLRGRAAKALEQRLEGSGPRHAEAR
jgi:hypothetical protein